MAATKEKDTSKALAKIEPVSFEIATADPEFAQVFQQELAGMQDNIKFPRMKIPAGGMTAFEVPGDDPDSPDVEKVVEGIIVDHHPTSALWLDEYEGGSTPPDAWSMDGVTQEMNDRAREAGALPDLTKCPFNKWGSAEEGNGKRTKNMHRIYLLRDGDMFPLLLTLPPTSLQNWTEYLSMRLLGKMNKAKQVLRPHQVITKVALEKAQNQGGIDYSKAKFSIAGYLSAEDAAAAMAYGEQLKPLTRKLAIVSDEAGNTESGSAGTTPTGEDTPF